MVLPLYLAVTGAEMSAFSSNSFPMAYMACHFSPYTQGLVNIPDILPEHSMLILTDRMPCQGHSADLVVQQLQGIVELHRCESLLLDFQRPPEPESVTMADQILQSLPCPVAVTEGFAAGHSCPVFLSPAPLHMPLSEYLRPWQDREIWLEAALEQETVAVTEKGATFSCQFPPEGLVGGFYEECLRCHYRIKTNSDRITFTLFDTMDSLAKKLELAKSLGVKRAVGLWQELGML